ncbi:single-stranded DNA-binding protein [Galbitalea soli]|uniref:Single-stranded DNA-binding protein n=1 Tax=Galbitalea soli TaxID=1268042 RepID=A0A7C9PNU7_9MICO|nr:single-stranded DNA-binding protein [Galbitalea soli]NEM91669.1 single-stranded DNA-binding protein [Galbitalea soli]NYJ30365.1 single-strand DNA-binding protein [Galbitalea soli]
MPDTISLTGLVATPPRSLTTAEGLAITSFRLASSQRRYDRAKERWVDVETNWYTVTAFRQLASNAGVTLRKGDRVVVAGRVRVRNWESGEKSGTTVEVEAEAIGPDLSWGTAVYSHNPSSAHDAADRPTPGGGAAPGSDQPTAESAANPSSPVPDDATPVPF